MFTFSQNIVWTPFQRFIHLSEDITANPIHIINLKKKHSTFFIAFNLSSFAATVYQILKRAKSFIHPLYVQSNKRASKNKFNGIFHSFPTPIVLEQFNFENCGQISINWKIGNFAFDFAHFVDFSFRTQCILDYNFHQEI